MDEEERRELIATYEAGAAEVDRALLDIGRDGVDRRPDDGSWSAREVVHHLADSEMRSAIRLRRLIAEDEPLIQGYDEAAYVRRLHVTARPIASSVDAAAAARASSLTILETLTEDEWTRTGRHSESGDYSVEDWLRTYADHPHDHADQARRVLAALRAG